MNSLSKFLLIRTDRVGDTLLTLPTVTAIREAYPDAKISFMIRPYTRALAEHYRGIDQVIIYDPDGLHQGFQGHLKLGQELSAYSFDAAILFHARFEIAAAVTHAGIPVRVGTAYRWYSFLFTHRVQEHRKDCLKHELDYNLSLLSGILPDSEQPLQAVQAPIFDFELPEALSTWRSSTLSELNITTTYAIMHPGSGASAPNLDVQQYHFVLEELLQQTSWMILLTGSPQEEKLVHAIMEELDEEQAKRVKSVTGKFTLEEFMCIIQTAKLLLTSSTGPIHIANALQTPVLGFYCHAVPHTAKRWGPYHQQEWVISSGLTNPEVCKQSKCPHGGCLQKLPQAVLQKRVQERVQDLL